MTLAWILSTATDFQTPSENVVMAESRIIPRARDFAAWYQDAVLQGEMAEPAHEPYICGLDIHYRKEGGFRPTMWPTIRKITPNPNIQIVEGALFDTAAGRDNI
jgi:hypothetical protein